ncbi:MAG: sulfurtransferase TusA family protein [Anaerolineaceae bacterium]|nr:sulfurtransferase TusA family protein [Anaerolineaceae bacterium]
MSKVVDVRGLSCPQPVILVQNAIDEGQFPIEVWLDSVTSRENVRRMATRSGCSIEITEKDDEFLMVLKK